MPLNFRQDPSSVKSAIVLVVLLALSLVLLVGYAREGSSGLLHNAQGTMSSLFTPSKVLSGMFTSAEQAATQGLADATADEETLSALRRSNEELRETVAQMEEYYQEAQRLQQLLDVKDSYSMEGVTCRVISRSTDSWNQVLTIDAGTEDGIRAGLPVVGGSGLVGQIISASATTAEVRLLQDPQSGVAALIQSNRKQGIVTGSFDGLLYLEDVDSDAQVQAGDVIITSGLGGGYYRGIMIGTVVKVDGAQGDENRKIILEANDSASPLEEVMVVTAMNSAGLADDEDDSSSGSSSSGDEDDEGSTGSKSNSGRSEGEE